MTLTGIREEKILNGKTKKVLIAVIIEFKCLQCGIPVKMKYNILRENKMRRVCYEQADQQLCTCDFNRSYKCMQSNVEKIINMMEE